MNALSRRVRAFAEVQGRSWLVRSVLVVILLYAIVRVLAWWSAVALDRDREGTLEAEASERLRSAVAGFARVQDGLLAVALRAASLPSLGTALASAPVRKEDLFVAALQVSETEEVGVEIFDRRKNLLAWGGRSGPLPSLELDLALGGTPSSLVKRASVDLQLEVIVPVRSGEGICGALLVRRILETSAPFASRGRTGPGLTAQLEEALGTAVEFSFPFRGEHAEDGRYVTASLHGIDGKEIGSVSLLRPGPGEILEGRMELSDRAERSLLLLLLFLGGVWGWRAWPNAPVRIAIIWTFRYGLILFDFPTPLLPLPMFDPVPFAAKFGGGLARSIGDLFLTVAAAGTSTFLAVRSLLRLRPVSPGRGVFLLAGVPLAVIQVWALRGYAAVVRSVVIDSSVEYLDPRTIFPSVELSLMMVNLLALAFFLLSLLAAATTWILRIGGTGGTKRSFWTSAGVLLLLFTAASFLFGIISRNPLAGLGLRLIFGAGILLIALLIERGQKEEPGFRPMIVGLSVALAAVILYPLLEASVTDHDRGRIEAMGQGVVRPVDRWFSLVVEEGLRSFLDEDAVRMIREGDENEIARIAYTRWLRNPASREGYTSIFTYFDPSGYVRSRFAIGGQLAAAVQVDTSSLIDNVREVEVREIGRGAGGVKVYQGLTDIPAPEGGILGFGQVTIAAGQQTLFRGETPAALRAGVGGSLQSFYRPTYLAEFKKGVLQQFSMGVFPRGSGLPAGISEELASSGPAGVWGMVEQGETYETLYIRRPGTEDEIVAISVASGGMAGRLIGIVAVAFHALILGSLLLLGMGLASWCKGGRLGLTFRGKLLVGMVLTALIPLVALTLYGRVYTAGRLLEESRRTLEDETETVASALFGDPGGADKPVNGLTPGRAEGIASEINTDFTIFINDTVQATSRPELFDLSLLDRRLSGGAHAALLLGGKGFTIERETIGKTEYAIGYRPVTDSTGTVVAVIAVPTLFRQERLEEESTRRNAVLFGVYLVVLAGVLLMATTLTNRIAAPLRELTAATRRVATGDLSPPPAVANADRELQELIDAFGAMTRDLARSRDELVRVERELAWKEMAKQVAHEIKNPLTPMRLSVQHLRQAYRDGIEGFADVLERVSGTLLEQIETLSRIASEFSHFARMPRRRMEACSVAETLREAVHLFAQDREVTFGLRLAEEIPPVMADREELRRAFINIIRNGIQAMEGKGRIEVEGSTRGGEIQVRIRDHGRGIAEEARRRLFEPNFSTKTDGMGLGLAIVRKTIEDLGGSITLSDAPGGGTLATLTLPAGRGEE